MSIALLIAIIVLLLVLMVAAPLHYLLAVSLLLVAVPGAQWQLGSVSVDAADLVYAAVLASVILRGRPSGRTSTPT